MFRVVENVRKKHLNWINFILAHKNWSRNRLSKEAEISPSTLTKFFSDRTGSQLLNSYSIEKIEKASGIPPFETSLPELPRGVVENESGEYEVEDLTTISAAVKTFINGNNSYQPAILKSRSLELAGYMPGDILIIDKTATPKAGDAVCGQIISRRGTPDKIIRIFEDPFLFPASADQRLLRPLLIDGHNVKIYGVIIASFRERRAAA